MALPPERHLPGDLHPCSPWHMQPQTRLPSCASSLPQCLGPLWDPWQHRASSQFVMLLPALLPHCISPHPSLPSPLPQCSPVTPATRNSPHSPQCHLRFPPFTFSHESASQETVAINQKTCMRVLAHAPHNTYNLSYHKINFQLKCFYFFDKNVAVAAMQRTVKFSLSDL